MVKFYISNALVQSLANSESFSEIVVHNIKKFIILSNNAQRQTSGSTPSPWLTRTRFTRISLTRIFKKFPFLT